jgi:hypothetical protein
MKPLSKILSPFSGAVNSTLSGMSHRTTDLIRQIYIFIILALCVVGIIFGVSLGKKSAKVAGLQLAETTNRIFASDVLQSKDEGGFGSILESEMRADKEFSEPKTESLPAREKLRGDDSLHIVEPDRDRHIRSSLDVMERRDLPEPSRLDEANPVADNPVRTIERPLPKSKGEVVDKKTTTTVSSPSKKSDIRNEKPLPLSKDNKKIRPKPIDKSTVISE